MLWLPGAPARSPGAIPWNTKVHAPAAFEVSQTCNIEKTQTSFVTAVFPVRARTPKSALKASPLHGIIFRLPVHMPLIDSNNIWQVYR